MNEDELESVGVYSWGDIKDRYKGADILLGNGLSIKVHDEMRYGSLYDVFLGMCDDTDEEFFNGFEHTDFEVIQSYLSNAIRVNNKLSLETDVISDKKDRLKEGLIGAVHRSHPSTDEIDRDYLRYISEELNFFGNVFTTNYDLFTYQIIMIVKEEKNQTYNDRFWDQPDYHNPKVYLKFRDFNDIDDQKDVFYLHGALFINDRRSEILKIQKYGGRELIDMVSAMINNNQFPLFVSEARSSDKLKKIMDNRYLEHAYKNFRKSGKKLVSYGFSFSDNDDHIAAAIDERRRDIAVSIYHQDKNKNEVQAEVSRIKSKLSSHNVVFFDSSSLF